MLYLETLEVNALPTTFEPKVDALQQLPNITGLAYKLGEVRGSNHQISLIVAPLPRLSPNLI